MPRAAKRARPDTEPAGAGAAYLDPYEDLHFDFGTDSRRRLWVLLGKEHRAPRSIDWDLLATLGDRDRAERIVGQAGQTPWRRLFDRGLRTAYRELTLEFLSTFEFTPPAQGAQDRVTHRAARFRLGGQAFELTLAEWAVHLGFYTVDETLDPRFYTDEIYSEPIQLVAYWPEISRVPWGGIIRATSITDPLHRYIHRCIASTITGRHQSQEQVTFHDIFYLRSLVSSRRANLAHGFGSYLLSVPQAKVCHLLCLFVI
jgi:hypothetical protein